MATYRSESQRKRVEELLRKNNEKTATVDNSSGNPVSSGSSGQQEQYNSRIFRSADQQRQVESILESNGHSVSNIWNAYNERRNKTASDLANRYNALTESYKNGNVFTSDKGQFQKSVDTLIRDFKNFGAKNGQEYIDSLEYLKQNYDTDRLRSQTASGLLSDEAETLRRTRNDYQTQLDALLDLDKKNRGSDSIYAEIQGVERTQEAADRQKSIQDLQGKIGDIDSILNIYDRVDAFKADSTDKYAAQDGAYTARRDWNSGRSSREQDSADKLSDLRTGTPYAARENGVSSAHAYAAGLNGDEDNALVGKAMAYDKSDSAQELDRLDDYLTWFENLSEDDQSLILKGLKTPQELSNVSEENNVTSRPYGSNRHWEYMTQDEIKAVYQIANTEGADAAVEYLDNLQFTLDRRNTLSVEETIRTGAENAPVGLNMLEGVLSVPAQLISGPVSFVGNALDKVQGKEWNPYSNANSLMNQISTVRSAASQDIYQTIAGDGDNKYMNALGELASNAYQAGLSTLDSLAGMYTMGSAYTVTMGMGAASSRMRELYESGASDEELYIGSIGSGILEALFEKVSLDTFADQWLKNNPEKYIKKMLIQAGVEGSEEVFTELGNMILDAVNRGVNSDHSRRVRELMNDSENPMTQAEAEQKAAAEEAMDVFWAGFGGALSGGFSSVGGAVAENVNNRAYGRSIAETGNPSDVVSDALELRQDDSTAARLSQRMESGSFGRKGSDYSALARVAQQNTADLLKKDTASVEAAIRDRASSIGVRGDADALARAIRKSVTGESLSMTDRYALAQNRSAADKISEEIFSAAENKTEDNAWVSNISTYTAMYPGTFGTKETEAGKSARSQMEESVKSIFGKQAPLVMSLYHQGQNRSAYIEEFTKVYRAGQEGVSLDSVLDNRVLTGKQAEAAYSIGKDSVGRESFDYGSQSDGQSIRKSDNTPVNITGFSDIGDTVSLSTDDGGTVNVEDVSFGSYGQARLYRVLSGMGIDAEQANEFLEAAGSSRLSDSAFAVALNDAYISGRSGVSLANISQDSVSMRLDEKTRKAAWEVGRAAAEGNDARKQATIDRGTHGKRDGGLVMEDSAKRIRNLNKQQQSAMDAANVLSAMGIPVTVFASTKADREANMENGSIRLSDGSIRVDLNAGDDGRGVMAYALSHEFTHFVEEMSSEKFRTFTDILFAEVGKTGEDVDGLIQGKMAMLRAIPENKGKSENELTDLARSEVVAEMMETAFSDTDIISRISSRLQQTDRSLWGRIKNFLKGLVEKLKAAYKDMQPDSSIARLASETIRNSEAILNAYADAAADAVVNYNLQDEQKNTAPEGVQYSLRGKTQKEITARYQSDVDRILNMQDTTQRQLIVGYTPSLYQDIGMPSLPLTIGSGHVYSAAKTEAEALQDGNYRRGVNYHGLGDTAVKNIYIAIQDPVMIIASRDVNKNTSPMRSTHSVVAIVDIGTAEKSLLVPIEITAERKVNGTRMDVNTISSVYERSVSNLVKEAIALENSGDVGVYYAKKEALTLPGAGVRFPVQLQQSIASNSIVHRFSEKVNMKISENTQSQQFKRWFGDWQNDPANASKVVNADGTPKVMYHGTNAEFTVFDRSKGKKKIHLNVFGDGNYFTASEQGAARYGENVVPAYLNIKNPYVKADGFNTVADQIASEFGIARDSFTGKDVSSILRKRGYDGVVMYDGNGEIVIANAFDSNQIKSATDNVGTFDGSNPDIRYSSRTQQEKALQKVEAENERLKTDVEYLKKLVQIQKAGNKDFTLDRNSVKRQAVSLMRQNNAKGDSSELAEMLDGVYRYVGTDTEITWEGFREKAEEAADWLMEHRVKERDRYAQEVLDFMAKRRIRLDDSQIAEAKYQFGSLNEFRKAINGTVVLDRNANTSLDQFWQEAAGRFPGQFDSKTTSTDQVSQLAYLVQDLMESQSTEEAERAYYADEEQAQLVRQIYDGYWNVQPVKSVSDQAAKQIDQLKAEHREAIRSLKQAQAEAMRDFRKEAKAALKEYRRQRDVEAKAMKAVYESERKQVELSYKKEMNNLRETYTGNLGLYQDEFLNVLNSMDGLNEKTIPEIRKRLRESAEQFSGKDKNALQARMQEYGRLLDGYSDSRDIDKLKETIQEKNAQAKAKVESAEKTEIRGKTQRVLNQLNRMLLNPSKNLYVPDILQNAVALAMQAANQLQQEGLDETIERVLARYEERLSYLRKDPVKNREKIQETERKLAKTLERKNVTVRGSLLNLQNAYSELIKNNEGRFTDEYNDGILNLLDSALSAVGETRGNNLSKDQLQAVYEAYKGILTAIRSQNKMFASNLKKGYEENARAVYSELEVLPSKSSAGGEYRKAMESQSWNNMMPVYAFDRLGSQTMSRLFGNLRHGEDVWQQDFAKARAYAMGTMDKYHYDGWEDSVVELESSTGKKFTLNLEERLSLYAYSKREQALYHLTNGGIVLNETKRTVKNAFGVRTEQVFNDSHAYNLKADDVLAIRDGRNILGLTTEQMAFADEMQEYLSTVCAEQNNEVSRALYGVSIAKEKYYWPIKVSGIFSERARQSQENPVNRQKNAAHMKATVKKASNPIELSGFMETWASHVNNTAMYHAFTLPMEDFFRVYNWKTGNGADNETTGIRQMILEKHGKAAVDYIDQFLKDLNGGLRADPRESAQNLLLSRFKKSAVAFSLSVAIQQPSAIGRAFAVIDPKYFVGTKVSGIKGLDETWNVMQKYAPVVGLKDIGRFDMGTGKSTIDLLTGQADKGFMAKLDNFSGSLPELMDKVTWCSIWEAAKRQTKAENPNLSGEDLLTAAGNLFTECITRTQVYDSVFARSGNMRSKTNTMKMLTSFMAEPTVTANMALSAVRDAKAGSWNTAGKKLASIGTAVILNSILASLVYASRDDDEEKTWVEKYLKSLSAELIDGVNPLGYIPGVKDIFSIFQGYDVERSDMSLWAALAKTVTKFSKAWKSYSETDEDDVEARREALKEAGKASVDMAAGILNLFGIPLKNVLREIRAAGNVIDGIRNPKQADSSTYGYAIWQGLNEYLPEILRKSDGKSQQLYKAISSGSEAWIGRMRESYEDEKSYQTAVVSSLMKNDPRIRRAAKAIAVGNDDTAQQLIDAIKAEKRFTEDQVDSAIEKQLKKLPGASYDDLLSGVRAGEDVSGEMEDLARYGYSETQMLNNVKSAIQEWYQSEEISKQEAISKLQKYFGYTNPEASEIIQKWTAKIVTGTDFSEIKDLYLDCEITKSKAIDMYVRYGGYDRDDAEKIITKWGSEIDLNISYEELPMAYKRGKITESTLLNALMLYGGLDKEAATEKVAAYKWQKTHPGYDLEFSEIQKYTETIKEIGGSLESMGISPDVFQKYSNLYSQCKGENKREQVLSMIDSLPITSSQKDALYYASGYSKNTIRKTPWH